MSGEATHASEAVRLPVVAAVLAGGRSRRMGTDKRALQVGGKSMLSRVVDAARQVCEQTMVVVAQDEQRLGDGSLGGRVTIVHDLIPRIGPLGGIITALDAAETPWVVVLAADTPFLEPEAIRLLWKHRGERGAVAFSGARGFEPLLALYHTDCLRVARDMLTERRAGPRGLLERVETVAIPIDALRGFDPGLRSLVNVNTPNEYTEVLREQFTARRMLPDVTPSLLRAAVAEEAALSG